MASSFCFIVFRFIVRKIFTSRAFLGRDASRGSLIHEINEPGLACL